VNDECETRFRERGDISNMPTWVRSASRSAAADRGFDELAGANAAEGILQLTGVSENPKRRRTPL
jgi:hypothetical protein